MQKPRSNNNKKGKNPAFRSSVRSMGPRAGGPLSHPPQLHPEITGSKIFRFQSTGAFSGTITMQFLLQLFVIALTNATSSRLWRSIRLRKVSAWLAPSQGGAAAEISIAGIGAGPENRVADSSMGVTPAHVVWRPAVQSLAGLWVQSGAQAYGGEGVGMFEATFPTNTVIDVSLDYIFADEDTAVSGPTPAGATAGVVYVVPLDGSAAGVLVPQDYNALP